MDAAEQQRYLDEHIPYRMFAISWGLHLLRGTREWDEPKHMDVIIDGKRCITGSHLVLTNPGIEIAVIYSRVLLEFLGLRADKQKKLLRQVDKRRTGDVGIEHFGDSRSPLAMVTPQDAFSSYPGPAGDAESALIVLIEHADLAVAHLTTGPLQDDRTTDLIELGCRGVLTLVHRFLYRRLGREPPGYEIKTVERKEAGPTSPSSQCR